MTKTYKMWINGKWVEAESGKTYPVFNPATEAGNRANTIRR